MKEDIYNFSKQFSFLPKIENEERWGNYQKYVLAGVGGSHLQGDFFLSLFPSFPLFLHQNYGLPAFSLENTGVIIASYSGNTEETIDAYNTATAKGMPVIIISKGGKLLEIAKEKKLPYIELPQNNVQPRLGLGYSFKALLTALRFEEVDFVELAKKLEKRKEELEKEGEKLASHVKNNIPIIYASQKNSVLANIWKINFNETAKIPSFYNIFPEVNHNEMTGFDTITTTKQLSEKMSFLLLRDKEDDVRIQKRMDALKVVLQKRKFDIFEVEIAGESRREKLFSSLLMSAFTSYYTALFYNVNPDGVPMIEEFKKII
jgi:glucose/mannose-6-phosphate isomerase